MQIPIENFSGNEPNLSECRTKIVYKDLSQCLSHNATCMYAFFDCCTSIYCLNPGQGNHQSKTMLDSRQSLKTEAPHSH
jgi:hypothetical protein